MKHSLFSVQPKKGVIASWYQSVFCCCFSVVLNGCYKPQNYVRGVGAKQLWKIHYSTF